MHRAMKPQGSERMRMAISNTKLKTLYIMKILLERTDENHVMSAADLVKALSSYGLAADRKTVYSDIETLAAFGLDIVQVKGGTKPGYYIGARDFELPELKLLVDAVQASKFITAKKSGELIEKIERLASENDAKQLKRNVVIFNRIKTGNETIYFNVDQIHTAILTNQQIKFQYTEWSMDKELVAKRAGAHYVVSPWALTWDDENYYLIAYEEATDKIKHYRVDKMKNAAVIAEGRLGQERFADFDLAAFSKKTFGMYGGDDVSVSLVCAKHLVGVVIDRFSKDVMIIPEDAGHFRVNVTVSVSPQFFGWVTGLSGGIYIDGPAMVKNEYRAFLKGILEGYGK